MTSAKVGVAAVMSGNPYGIAHSGEEEVRLYMHIKFHPGSRLPPFENEEEINFVVR